jgi:hypothetical protein
MKAEDKYLRFVRWEEEDHLYVGYCPDLFPWGGVCHATTEEEAYRQLCALVLDEVEELRRVGKELPQANTRPMREAVPA